MLLFSLSSTAFADESYQASDKYAPTATFQIEEDNAQFRVPNGIPITVAASYDTLSVWVGNIGVDSLDNVTVTGTATNYGNLPARSGKVPPVVGKTFTWSIPMTKTTMEYRVTITVVDGSGTRTLRGEAKLEYDETKLASIGWHKGTFSTRAASLQYHFDKHKGEVGSTNLYDYLLKAGECRDDVANNPSDYTKTVGTGPIASHKYKHKTNGKFIILTDAGKEILSFGR